MTETQRRGMGTAIQRWAGLGPYYAMFPVDFAFNVIQEYSRPGDAILDPFAGRASSIYAAAAFGRYGCGIEINPVGWLYGRVKLRPAPLEDVLARISEIAVKAQDCGDSEIDSLPEFFAVCYAPKVLRYLCTARQALRWEKDTVDGTVMALLLVYLHGKMRAALSNQMRQGKAMSPDYSVAWWKAKGYEPPNIDPVPFLLQRVKWRYAKGRPQLDTGTVILGDSTTILPRLRDGMKDNETSHLYTLLFTSPPYYSVTNYYYDQWLRLWMLGGSPYPTKKERGPWQGKFESQVAYQSLIQTVFHESAKIMNPSATIYVRADARPFTFDVVLSSLCDAFPGRNVYLFRRPFGKSTQTALYGDKSQKPGEIDIILRPSQLVTD